MDEVLQAAIKALAAADKPLSVSQLLKAMPKPYRPKPDRLIELLDGAAAAGKLWRYKPYRSRQPRYWTQPPEVLGRSEVLKAVAKKPVREPELRKRLQRSNVGLPAEPADADAEYAARQFVVALARFIGTGTVLVLCFDQVEALMRQQRDEQALFAFGQLVATLHDSTDNLLIISSMQSSFMAELRRCIRGADYDRMREYGARALSPLDWAQARKQVRARLESVPELRELRRQATGGLEGEAAELWPLAPGQVQAAVGPGGCTPRRIIEYCASLFRSLQSGGPPGVPDRERLLRDEYDSRFEAALARLEPAATDHMLAQALPKVLAALRSEWQPEAGPAAAPAFVLVAVQPLAASPSPPPPSAEPPEDSPCEDDEECCGCGASAEAPARPLNG